MEPRSGGKSGWRRLLDVALAVLVVLYPVGVWWSFSWANPRIVSLALLGVFALRFALASSAGAAKVRQLLPVAGVVTLTSLLGAISGNRLWLLLTPALINFGLLVFFASTLVRPPTFAERFARIEDPELPPAAVRYCRRVTEVWCAFFVLNGSVALWTALGASREAWALYNGAISYVLIGTLAAGEYLVRRRFRARLDRELD